MKKMIIIGLGHVWRESYGKTVAKLKAANIVELSGTIDQAFSAQSSETGLPQGEWHVQTVQEIPQGLIGPDVVPMILTPDHYPVIEELAHMGFKNILCEKPLVSRVSEMQKVCELVELHDLKLYAVDFYLPKTFGLQAMRGLVGRDDPRYEWLAISNPEADFGAMLGEIEGIGVQVVEAGSFCLPDIAGRRYLAEDKEIGGMILDLVTHACGPLHQAGLLNGWEVLDASLSRLSNVVSGRLVPVKDASTEAEMYVTALLEADGVPIQLAFGKVPIARGGLWGLEVRGKKGMYYAGLRTGQPAVLISNDGNVVTFSLKMTTYEFVIREALLYFDGVLPGFDGNYGAFSNSMHVGRAILNKYQERKNS